jgi:hypothetical protein
MIGAPQMTLKTRAARKEFEGFPPEAQSICLTALTVAADGGKSDIAKPMQERVEMNAAERQP